MAYKLELNNTVEPLRFLLIDSADHETGKTGLAVASMTVVIRKNGEVGFSAPHGAVSEIGNGWYQVAANAVDANTIGPLILHAEAAGADPADLLFAVGRDGARVIPYQNAGIDLPFLMIDSANHVSGFANHVPTVTIAKNGGTFGASAGVSPVYELAYGWYVLRPNLTDANTLGPLILHAVVTGADPTDEIFDVVQPATEATSQSITGYTTTATQLITRALKGLGVIGGSETPTGSQLEDGFQLLNELVDSWNAQGWAPYVTQQNDYPLVAGQQDYTIGEVGAQWVQPRPVSIDDAGFLLSTTTPATVVPIEIFTDQKWTALSQPALTNPYPQGLYYAATTPNGTISVWPVPNANLTIRLFTVAAIRSFASLTTQYVLPPAYAQALRANLAVQWAPEFTVEPPGILVAAAVNGINLLKRNNLRIAEIAADDAYLQGNESGGDWRAIYTGNA